MDKHAFMRACREGGTAIEDALRALDRAFFGMLYRDALRALHDAAAAREVVQETFIQAGKQCAVLPADSELAPWIRAILRRHILDRLRRAERGAVMEDSTTEEMQRRVAELSRDNVPTPVDEPRAWQLAQSFQRCWNRLEHDWPVHAAMIRWIAEDRLTQEQIAALLDRPAGATREFVSECRKRARVYFAEWYSLAFETE
jgi:RNA polymerase sigma factor (sigma-70 family)